MYVSFDLDGYESSTMPSISDRMMYIDQMSRSGPYTTNIAGPTSYIDPDKGSMYGRKVEKEITAIARFILDIDKEIRETKRRIDYFADSGGRNGQRETEMRNVSLQLYKTKLDAIKSKAALEREIDKARKEDIKLYKDVNGSVPANTQILPDTISSDGNFMSNLLGNGVDDFFNSTIASSPMNIPPSVPQITQNIPTPQPMSAPEPVMATKPKESL